jgi:hypothetical protein
MVEIDTPEYYRIITNAYAQSSKHERVPFDPTSMLKIINNFEYLISIKVKIPFNFYNLLYLEMEKQSENGFLITPFLKKSIKYHRKINPPTFLIYCGELAYLQIARQM